MLTSLATLIVAAKNADGAILGVRVGNAKRFGTLRTKDGMLLGFEEKRDGKGVVNAGVYLFRPTALERFPRKAPLSFEYDVFPALVAACARIAVMRCQAPFIDIGTEESLARADEFIERQMDWFE